MFWTWLNKAQVRCLYKTVLSIGQHNTCATLYIQESIRCSNAQTQEHPTVLIIHGLWYNTMFLNNIHKQQNFRAKSLTCSLFWCCDAFFRRKWGLALTAVLRHCVILQLCLKEELLRTLCTVIYLVFLSMGWKYMLLQLVCLDKHCKTHRALEGATHSFKTVFDQVALELGWWIKCLTAQFALVIQSFINHVVCNMHLNVPLTVENHLALDALVCLLLIWLRRTYSGHWRYLGCF